jgi:hypothetical protein
LVGLGEKERLQLNSDLLSLLSQKYNFNPEGCSDHSETERLTRFPESFVGAESFVSAGLLAS